jgi:hypothetical protein
MEGFLQRIFRMRSDVIDANVGLDWTLIRRCSRPFNWRHGFHRR